MFVKKLQRAIEEQERHVAFLWQEKRRRDALLSKIRGLMNSAEPWHFEDLNRDLGEFIFALEEGPPKNKLRGQGLTSSSAYDVDSPKVVPVFSKEIEERIMLEEEPCLREESLRIERRRKLKRDGKKNRKPKKGKKSEVDLGGTLFTEQEIFARNALLAAVDALQMNCSEMQTTKTGVLPWLSDAESQGNNAVEKEEYSDDFEELTDVENKSH